MCEIDGHLLHEIMMHSLCDTVMQLGSRFGKSSDTSNLHRPKLSLYQANIVTEYESCEDAISIGNE